MQKRILVIWDRSHKMNDDDNKRKYFKEFFFDQTQHSFFSDIVFDVIDDPSELLIGYRLNNSVNFDEYDGVVILLKLNWDFLSGKYNGLEVLRLLRENRYKAPVFIVSQDKKEDIYQSKNQLTGLLKTPGTYLIDAFSFKIDLKDSQEPQQLSDKLLDDLLYYTTHKTGFLEEIIHNTKNKLPQEFRKYTSSEINNIIDTISNIIPFIRELIPSEKRQFSDDIWNSLFETLKQSSVRNNKIKPADELYKAKSSILSFFSDEEDDVSAIKSNGKWNVLYVDDDKHFLNDMRSRLDQFGIHCFTAQTGLETFEILKNDKDGVLMSNGGRVFPPNSITVLVCDWRMQNELEEWHSFQGYDIIDIVAHEYTNSLSFFMLTSKKGGIIRNVQKASDYKINWFAKDDVLQSEISFIFFIDKIIEMGDSTYNSILFRPGSTAWKYKTAHRAKLPLGEYYRQFRMSTNYKKMEDEIADLAIDFYEQAKTVMEYHEEVFSQRALEVESEITPSAEMKSEKLNEVWLQFRDRMVARRVALALYKMEEWDTDDISSILLSKKLGGKPNRWFFSEAMCLSAKMDNNFGDQTLIEEINWFEKEFDYKVHFLNDKLRRALKGLFMGFGKKVKEELKDSREKYREVYNNYIFLFDYKEPKTFEDITKMFSQVEELIDSDASLNTGLKSKWETVLKKFLNNKGNREFMEKINVIL